ncbi:MAG: hypothetical protein IPP74_15055 [Alphaproteobacteria bacterium]|nr:hypothetical protein [Alphaproteobacteria bacterium]
MSTNNPYGYIEEELLRIKDSLESQNEEIMYARIKYEERVRSYESLSRALEKQKESDKGNS